MKKILVPVDFSEVSESAFRFALKLARKSRAEVLVLHVLTIPTVYDPVSLPLGTMELQSQIEKDMRVQSLENYQHFEERWVEPGDRVAFSEEFGITVETIHEIAVNSGADLIVMGARKVTGMEEFFFHSHAGEMVHHTEVPTLFIKDFFEPDSIKTIVFPNSLELDQDDLMHKIKALQEFLGAELKVLYINTPYTFRSDKDTQLALEKFAHHYNLKNYTLNIFSDQDEETGIANFRKSFHNALIAMSTHGRKGFRAFLDGSITKNLVDHFDYPIWAVLKK